MPGRSHGSSYTHPPRTLETVMHPFPLAFAGKGLQSVEGLALRGGVHDKWRGYTPSTLRHPLH